MPSLYQIRTFVFFFLLASASFVFVINCLLHACVCAVDRIMWKNLLFFESSLECVITWILLFRYLPCIYEICEQKICQWIKFANKNFPSQWHWQLKLINSIWPSKTIYTIWRNWSFCFIHFFASGEKKIEIPMEKKQNWMLFFIWMLWLRGTTLHIYAMQFGFTVSHHIYNQYTHTHMFDIHC